MNRCCVCGKNYIVFSTGTVWNRKTQRHEDAGFCGYGCLDIAEDTLKPHIVKRKNGGNMDEHSHDSVYCFGVKGQRKKRRLAERGGRRKKDIYQKPNQNKRHPEKAVRVFR